MIPILAALLLLQGCVSPSATPEAAAYARWMQARELLTQVELSAVAAWRNGLIDHEDLRAMDPYVLAARTHLTAAEAILPREDDSIEAAIRLVNDLILRLAEAKAAHAGASP